MANILLIEPGYRAKFPPLGLMKIAQYHGPNGKRDKVKFIKGIDRSVLGCAWDRIYVTTMFSFEWKKTAEAIDFACEAAGGQHQKIFVGGISATLMNERYMGERRWSGIRFIKGLLDQAPAVSLDLDEFWEELYADDTGSTPIEYLTPDYSILEQVSYRYQMDDAYFLYASRGCIRTCKFCGVPALEGGIKEMPKLAGVIGEIDRLYGPRRDLLLMDNNVVASPRFKEIIAEIRDLGFTPGAHLIRRGRAQKRRVDFNQGVDARILAKDPMFLRELSTICLSPLRIAFDHLGLKGPYETAIRIAHEHGLTELSNYMLYNFHDSPEDLYLRLALNLALNEELGTRIYSFPMRYAPNALPDRSHIGERWTRYQLRSFQIMLQATRGVASGEPDFFRYAYGATSAEFHDLLLLPHRMLFNRAWYERLGGAGERDDFQENYWKLSDSQKSEMLVFLSGSDPTDYQRRVKDLADPQLRALAMFYVPISKDEEQGIWQAMRADRMVSPEILLDDDLLVEDAGLEAVDEVA